MTSCGDSPESVMDDTIDCIKEVTEIVEGVNDGDNASDAVDDINDLKEDMKEIAQRVKELKKDRSDKEEEEIGKLLEGKKDEVVEVLGDLMGELVKLSASGTDGAKDVAEAVQEFMSTMN